MPLAIIVALTTGSYPSAPLQAATLAESTNVVDGAAT